jgi:ABC-type branched-subunit amino acid transport system ATPase component
MSTTEAAAPDTVIDVHGFTKSFNGRAVVRDLSMQVKRGTIFGFLGPSGFAATPGSCNCFRHRGSPGRAVNYPRNYP